MGIFYVAADEIYEIGRESFNSVIGSRKSSIVGHVDIADPSKRK